MAHTHPARITGESGGEFERERKRREDGLPRWNFDLYVNRQTAVVADVGKCAAWYGTLLPLVTILEISCISRHLLYFEVILVDMTENLNFNY